MFIKTNIKHLLVFQQVQLRPKSLFTYMSVCLHQNLCYPEFCIAQHRYPGENMTFSHHIAMRVT